MKREYTNIDAVLKEDLDQTFGDKVDVVITRPHRVFVTINRDVILDVVRYLRDTRGLIYVSTITGLDAGDHFEMLYHFQLEGTNFTIKAIIPHDDPVIDSITPIIPGAMLYESEAHDLLGIFSKGHPNPTKQVVLPEDWPEGEYPLRKSWPPDERGVR